MKMIQLCSIALLSLSACAVMAQQPVEITGLMKKNTAKPVRLFKVSDGKTVETASVNPDENGRFGFIFYPEYEGLYVVGSGNEMSPNDNYKFYFKGGDKLSLTLLDSSYVLNDKLNSKENVVLTQWHDLANPIEQKAINFMKSQSTYVDFFPQLEATAVKAKGFLKGKATGNKRFDQAVLGIMNLDMASYATNFLNTPRTAHPSVEEYSSYYSTMKTTDFSKNTKQVYSYPWGQRVLSALISVDMRKDGVKYKSGLEGMKDFLTYLPNDTLKGDLVLQTASGYKSFSDYQGLMAAYGKYVLTKEQKLKNEKIMSPLLTYKAGEASLNFSYPDQKGKMVSMNDLKGKVVLIDVWATWCGPCKGEIPHLKKLEEEMKGKNVEFVSISVDEAKDKDKWLKMIETDQLGGTQLFASGWSEIAKYYKINGIPRFMVFDKAGKIVTVDSPRPSSPELKALLEKTLLD
jgi:thiol-disulfide isomerase/thioredoxin